MATHETDGALVCVWRNAPLRRITNGSFGHVSLKLVGPSYAGREPVYVSWWPGVEILRERVVLGLRLQTTRANARNTYKRDERNELGERALARLRGDDGPPALPRPNQRCLDPERDPASRDWIRVPDAKVFLPALGPGRPYGLNLLAVEMWWRVYAAAPAATWSTLERNCSTIVAKALRAGGAASIVRRPRCLVMRPTVVEAWARALAARCAKRNAETVAVVRDVGRLAMADHAELWSARTWLAKNAGARRPTEAAERVAAALRGYEAYDAGEAATHDKRIELLQGILDVLHDDVHHAGAGRRPDLESPLRLSLQCVAAIERSRRAAGAWPWREMGRDVRELPFGLDGLDAVDD